MRYALGGVRRRPGRSALAGLGIGLATALVIALLSLSAGVEESAARLAVASGVDLLATSANTTLSGASFPPVTGAHGAPEALGRADANVATASPWLVSDLVYANDSLYRATNASAHGRPIPQGWAPTEATAIGWIPHLNLGLNTPQPVTGAGFSDPGDPHYASGSYSGRTIDETVLDTGLASALHVGPGSTVWVSPRSIPNASGLPGWFAGAHGFRVAGLSGPFWLIPSAQLGFFYLSELQSVEGGGPLQHDEASVILFHLKDATNPGIDRDRLEIAFPSLTIFTLGDVLGTVRQAVELYRTFGTLIGGIGITVAALFSSTVLLMSVDDRSQEIALLRAIGFSRATIGRYVLEESALLSLLGLAIGAPLGYAMSWALNRAVSAFVTGVPIGFSFVSYDAGVAAGALTVIAAIALGAAAIPAWRAMSLPIIAELRAP